MLQSTENPADSSAYPNADESALECLPVEDVDGLHGFGIRI